MSKELNEIFENAKGSTIGIYKQSDKNICVEINDSEPEAVFTAVNLDYESNGNTIKLFDKFSSANYIELDTRDFIGANGNTNEFWIGSDNYAVLLYA